MTGKLVKEEGIFYVKKDGLKYPLTLKCLEIVAEIESKAEINLKKPVVFQIVSEDNVRKAIIPQVKVNKFQQPAPYTESDADKVHFFVSMIQAIVDFSEEHNIIKEIWTTPYSRALMAETNREFCRISSIPFNHVENALSALSQFQDSSLMVEKLFRLAMEMSKLSQEEQFKLQCQLENIFNFYNIKAFNDGRD